MSRKEQAEALVELLKETLGNGGLARTDPRRVWKLTGSPTPLEKLGDPATSRQDNTHPRNKK